MAPGVDNTGLSGLLAKGLQELKLADEHFWALALEIGDPDRSTHDGESGDDWTDRLKEFETVLELLPNGYTPSLFTALLTNDFPSISKKISKRIKSGSTDSARTMLGAVVDYYAEQLKKSLAVDPNVLLGQMVGELPQDSSRSKFEDLFAALSALEKKAFQYRSKGRELVIVDEEAYLQLRNGLKFLERIAYSDSDFLAKIDRPEMYRFSTLVAPELTAKDRGMMYRLEKGWVNLNVYTNYIYQNYLNFVKRYDGTTPFGKDPEVAKVILLMEWGGRHAGGEAILRAIRTYFRRNRWKVIQILDKGVPSRWKPHIRKLGKTSLEKLAQLHSRFDLGSKRTEDPKERKELVYLGLAMFWEFHRRGISLLQASKDSFLSSLRSMSNPYHEEDVDRMVQGMYAGTSVAGTRSRLDNYRSRDEFLILLEESFRNEIKRRKEEEANPKKKEPKKVEDLSLLDLYDILIGRTDHSSEPYFPHFDGLLGFFTSTAKGNKIPLETAALFAMIDRVREDEGISIEGGAVIQEPISWEQVSRSGKVMTVSRAAYPKVKHWLEDEWKVAKLIDYRGATLFEMAEPVVKTVTLAPKSFMMAQEIHGIEAGGTVRAYFKNIKITPFEADGSLSPTYKRLLLLAHEIFHGLQRLRVFEGIAGAKDYGLAREREAYFFGAHVVEEYLKLRLAHRDEYPIAKEEIDAAIEVIVFHRVIGFAASRIIAHKSFNMDPNDRNVELSPEVEIDLVSQYMAGELLQTGSQARLFNFNDDIDRHVSNFYTERGFNIRAREQEWDEENEQRFWQALGVLLGPSNGDKGIALNEVLKRLGAQDYLESERAYVRRRIYGANGLSPGEE